jgi:hypothetical protein
MPVQADYQGNPHVELVLEVSSCPNFINSIVSLAEKASSSSGSPFVACPLSPLPFSTFTTLCPDWASKHPTQSEAESSWNRHLVSIVPPWVAAITPPASPARPFQGAKGPFVTPGSRINSSAAPFHLLDIPLDVRNNLPIGSATPSTPRPALISPTPFLNRQVYTSTA